MYVLPNYIEIGQAVSRPGEVEYFADKYTQIDMQTYIQTDRQMDRRITYMGTELLKIRLLAISSIVTRRLTGRRRLQ